MLFVCVKDLSQIAKLPAHADGAEVRVDLSPQQIPARLPPFPVLFTVRKTSCGGHFQGTESQRQELIERLLQLKPPFFDLESDTDEGFLQTVLKKYPDTKFILSYHNFEKTPEDLEAVYQTMSRHPAYSYKLAAHANSCLDALRLLIFAKKHPKISPVCMGDKGSFARVLAKTLNPLVNYTFIKERLAPGQLSLKELVSVYRYPYLNSKTNIYGLIGDPVDQSQGHLFHNLVFAKQGINAVYVKMAVKPEELAPFFSLAAHFPFKGLSVTMPLKEKVVDFLSSAESSVGAINTLKIKSGKIYGTNTDGNGALDAIEKRLKVRGKKVVLLGAGGAAKAIGLEAKKRGAEVWIANRTLERAETLAKQIDGFVGIPEDYDMMINCSPEPIDVLPLSSCYAMDIVYVPKETPFLQKAKECGAKVIYGYEMFFNQALAQQIFWKK